MENSNVNSDYCCLVIANVAIFDVVIFFSLFKMSRFAVEREIKDRTFSLISHNISVDMTLTGMNHIT